MSEPIDIESLDPFYRDVFRDRANGTPDDISKSGCLVLAKLGKEAWNTWRSTYPVLYSKHQGYINYANFSELNFDEIGNINFSDFVFGDGANFALTRFHIYAKFARSVWGRHANLLGTRWHDWCNFSNAEWGDDANFQGAQWGYYANFTNAQWGKTCNFSGAQFGHRANFQNTIFLGVVDFSGCEWEELKGIYPSSMQISLQETIDWASARGCSPKKMGVIDFSGARFLGIADFSDRNFTSKTVMSSLEKNTRFEYAPRFHGSTLNQDTTFDGSLFPEPTGRDDSIRAYRTLKLAFSQQQAIREEQRFFKLEMEEEAAHAKGSTRWLYYKMYSLFGDYGFSIKRPTILLAVTLIAMMFIYGGLSYLHNCLPDPSACSFSTAWIEFSLLQSLPLPGLDKLSDTLRGQLFPSEGLISVGVTIAVILHKAISLLALFLMGLALRNLFKLK